MCLIYFAWSWDLKTGSTWKCLHIDGLAQDCSNSSALTMELLQSFTKPLICLVKIYKGELQQYYSIYQAPLLLTKIDQYFVVRCRITSTSLSKSKTLFIDSNWPIGTRNISNMVDGLETSEIVKLKTSPGPPFDKWFNFNLSMDK